MDVRRFIEQQQGGWAELESLLDRAEWSGGRHLSPDEVRTLTRAYRQASADLVLLRGLQVGEGLRTWLEGLVGRGHAVLHREGGSGRLFWQRLARWPALFRAESPFVLLSAMVFLLPGLLAFVIVAVEPWALDALAPAEAARLYGEAHDDLRSTRFGRGTGESYLPFAAELFVNNTRVDLNIWAGGLLFGVPTAWLLATNGVLIGAIAGYSAFVDGGRDFWALVVAHGVPELGAMVLAGAGGLKIASAFWVADRQALLPRLRERTSTALVLAAPALPLTAIAAVVEAFFTPLPIAPSWKFGVAVAEIVLLGWMVSRGPVLLAATEVRGGAVRAAPRAFGQDAPLSEA